MDKVSRLPADQRRDLFQESAVRCGVNTAIIEKDFWVCWVLKQLFTDNALQNKMVFKGGTSLSKVFGLIDRFSEDIDLVLDWRLLGYGTGQQDDPFQEFESKTQQDRFNKHIHQLAAEYIADTLIHDLSSVLGQCPGVIASIDVEEPHTVNIAYPVAFSEAYLRPEVRLEIGPLASWIPSTSHTVQPYAAEIFPDVFDDPICPVVAISAERTFWEKATILHQQVYRTGIMPSRYSRHYYDLYKLAGSPIRGVALADLGLLEDVVSFKQRFYPSTRAQYEKARPGTFKLIPARAHLAELRSDYRDMAMMIFGEIPGFDAIIDTLQKLEGEINGRE